MILHASGMDWCPCCHRSQYVYLDVREDRSCRTRCRECSAIVRLTTLPEASYKAALECEARERPA